MREVEEIHAGVGERQGICLLFEHSDSKRRLQVLEAQKAGPFTRGDKFQQQRLLLFTKL